ncbi:MAG: ATP-binding protein [Acidobacteria bacterium]|nr:ATP-binding protein [Acidobacteriota bacterium]
MASPETTRLPQPETCPHCGGTGWRPVEEADPASGGVRRVMRCSCLLESRPQRLHEAARIPPQYQPCDFQSFATSIYREQPACFQSLQEAKLKAQRFAEEYPVNTESGLLFMGGPGVGKTHLAVAILRRLLDRGFDCLFRDYQDLLKQIQSSYNPQAETSEMKLLEPILAAPVLLLDDLGSIKPSLWVLDTVGYVINQRYSHKRTTLITTNYLDAPVSSAGRGRAGDPDRLADRIGERMRSRLYEICRTVELQADDFRARFKKADYQPLR